VFKKVVLRRIFGPKRDEVAGGCRKLHNEKLHNLYSSTNIIRMVVLTRIIWMDPVAGKGDDKYVGT
jgi:hypothetical protein